MILIILTILQIISSTNIRSCKSRAGTDWVSLRPAVGVSPVNRAQLFGTRITEGLGSLGYLQLETPCPSCSHLQTPRFQ